MSNDLKNVLIKIDDYISMGEYPEAIDNLHNLAKLFPDEGAIPFYFGHLAQISRDYELALKYYLLAAKKGYMNADVFFSIAMLQKEMGKIGESEKYFNKALSMATESKEKWACYSALAIMFLENKMYLKAEKISKQLINDYRDNYEGYHIHIILEALQGNATDAKIYMEKLPEKFKMHPQYLIDKIDLCKFSGAEEEYFDLLNDTTVENSVPQIALREKFSNCQKDGLTEEKLKIIEILAKKFNDSDAVISMMIIEFANRNHRKSAQIANVILQNEKINQGIRYYLALYFQIYNFYYLSEKKPSQELIKWIGNAGNWCITFAENMHLPGVDDIISSAIRELFEEINKGQ